MLIDLLLILTGCLGLIVVFLILLNYKANIILNLSLIIIITVSTLRLSLLGLGNILKNSDLDYFNILITDYIGLLLPLGYLYFQNLINDKKTFSFKDLCHILFLLIIILERKLTLIEIVFNYKLNYNFYVFYVIYALVYDIAIFLLFKKHVWNKKATLDIAKKQNNTIRKWCNYFYIVINLMILRYYISFVLVHSTNVALAPTYGLWASAIVWIGLLLIILSSPKILYGYSYLTNNGININSKSINISNWTSISKSKINYSQDLALEEKIAANIENYIIALETSLANNNYFRKPEFTIKELALAIKIPVSHLKYLYKYHSKISFSDHKKIIRIKDALDLIDQNYLHTHTLESLSKKVGFASYNPFFTSFKEVVGKSPIQYISNLNGNLKSS